jgi:hypothetical protein
MNYAPNTQVAGIAANWLPFVVMSDADAGVRTPASAASRSALCATDNHRSLAHVAVLIRLKRIGQKCFSVWKPTLIKPRESS